MPASRSDITNWLEKLYSDPDITHMIIKCDDFDYRGDPSDKCCYPVYVTTEEDVKEAIDNNSDRTMEVYSESYTAEEQMSEHRAFHYD